ncbi:hypothetical protein K438DRAFT_1633225 [Mycena galopus ATCC 62051]|nr:hypothetical protein K438DRAFT_1633225 [Mycena galopus ATCC 62051]
MNANEPDLVLEEELDELPDLVAVSDSEDAESESDEEDSVWDELTAEERQSLLGQTEAVKLIISRVRHNFSIIPSAYPFLQIRQFSFAVVNSTTKGLPAWREACAKHGMRVRVIPRDVRTRWNSVYDMLAVAIEYKAVFNDMTASRDLDYRKFDISNAEWTLVEDMLHVLKVFFSLIAAQLVI